MTVYIVITASTTGPKILGVYTEESEAQMVTNALIKKAEIDTDDAPASMEIVHYEKHEVIGSIRDWDW